MEKFRFILCMGMIISFTTTQAQQSQKQRQVGSNSKQTEVQQDQNAIKNSSGELKSDEKTMAAYRQERQRLAAKVNQDAMQLKKDRAAKNNEAVERDRTQLAQDEASFNAANKRFHEKVNEVKKDDSQIHKEKKELRKDEGVK